jgi:hypothetical protein
MVDADEGMAETIGHGSELLTSDPGKGPTKTTANRTGIKLKEATVIARRGPTQFIASQLRRKEQAAECDLSFACLNKRPVEQSDARPNVFMSFLTLWLPKEASAATRSHPAPARIDRKHPYRVIDPDVTD